MTPLACHRLWRQRLHWPALPDQVIQAGRARLQFYGMVAPHSCISSKIGRNARPYWVNEYSTRGGTSG